MIVVLTDPCLLWASRPVQLVHQAISLENLLIVFLSMGSRSTLSRCGKFWPYRDLVTFDLVQMWQLLFQFLLHLCCLWNSLLQVSENSNWQWLLVLRETYFMQKLNTIVGGGWWEKRPVCDVPMCPDLLLRFFCKNLNVVPQNLERGS